MNVVILKEILNKLEESQLEVAISYDDMGEGWVLYTGYENSGEFFIHHGFEHKGVIYAPVDRLVIEQISHSENSELVLNIIKNSIEYVVEKRSINFNKQMDDE